MIFSFKNYHIMVFVVLYTKWFIRYLLNRSQFVSVNNINSPLRYITCGVLQGSVIGPLLFLIYITDIANCSTLLNFILYADDTSIFYSDPNLCILNNVINVELQNLALWFKANKLTLNILKANLILFVNK